MGSDGFRVLGHFLLHHSKIVSQHSTTAQAFSIGIKHLRVTTTTLAIGIDIAPFAFLGPVPVTCASATQHPSENYTIFFGCRKLMLIGPDDQFY
jgi:hypothetical protein